MRDGPGNLPPTRCVCLCEARRQAQAGSHAPLLVRGLEAPIRAVNQARTRTVPIAEINHQEEEGLLWDTDEVLCGETEKEADR